MTETYDTPEQIAVNEVRYALMGGDVPANSDVAGVMAVARTAFRAGFNYRNKPFSDSALVVQNFANNLGERIGRMVSQELADDEHSPLILGAYEKGRTETTDG
jgi:hypothetical protein